MEKFLLKPPLASCRAGKKLIGHVEQYLLQQIPRLLKKDLANMMSLLDLKDYSSLRKYAVSLEDGSETRELATVADFREEHFPPSLQGVFRISRWDSRKYWP